MKKIFITATNTDIGKTFVTCKLLKEYASKGFKVGAIKPIETGVVNGVYLDGDKLLKLQKELNKNLKDITINDVVPISFELPAAPFVASGLKEIDLKPVFESIKKFESLCDLLFIEGAGGLYVPINKDYFMIDLIKDLRVDETLLVTHCDLGCINDTLLSKKALDSYALKHNVYFNCKNGDESFKQISKPYFDIIALDFNMSD